MSKIPRLPGDGAQADAESNFDESSIRNRIAKTQESHQTNLDTEYGK